MRDLFEDHEGDDGLPGRERRIATLCLLVFTGMLMLDTSFVTVALPTMARDLRISESQSVWIVSTYQLAAAISILTFSALGGMLGFGRLFIAGVLVFSVASLGCAMSTSLVMLLVLRFLQGLGAAASTCVMAALYRLIFPTRLLGSALGVNALAVAGVMAIGPTLGGTIVSALEWPWLFAINVPLGALALWLMWGVLPPERARTQPFDIAGAVTSALAVGCLLLAVYGLGRPGGLHTAALFLVGAAISALAFSR
jgi:DHA2 family multidrug resistance protein-like MFS transporter